MYFESSPATKKNLKTLEHGAHFEFAGFTLDSLHTPGHCDDHTSFVVRETRTQEANLKMPVVHSEEILISGDIILGTPSALVDDLDTYLATMRDLQKRHLDFILLPHSLSYEPSDVLVPAHPKIDDYILYREDRLAQLLQALKDGG